MFCSDCRHLVKESPVPGDPALWYCSSEKTKLFKHPVGYVRKDAPACHHLIQIRQMVTVKPEKPFSMDELKFKVFKWALFALFLVVLGKVLAEELLH